jgi:soluble lytic murein transglycosylase-like protein
MSDVQTSAIPYADSITKWASAFGIDPAWIAAVIQTESSFRADIQTWEPKVNEYSWGLGQILFSTAQGLGYTGPAEGLLDPDTNIQYVAELLGQLASQYGQDLQRVYSAYNSGSADAYLTSSQVGANVARVMANYEKYAGAFGSTVAAESPNVPALSAGLVLAAIAFLVWQWRS